MSITPPRPGSAPEASSDASYLLTPLTPHIEQVSKTESDYYRELHETTFLVPPEPSSAPFFVLDKALPDIPLGIGYWGKTFVDNLAKKGILVDPPSSALRHTGGGTIHAKHRWWLAADLDFAVTVKMCNNTFKVPIDCLSRSLIEPFKAGLLKSGIDTLDLILAYIDSQPHLKPSFVLIPKRIKNALMVCGKSLDHPYVRPLSDYVNNPNPSLDLARLKYYLNIYEMFRRTIFSKRSAIDLILKRTPPYKTEDEFLKFFIGKHYIKTQRIFDVEETDKNDNITCLMVNFGLFNVRISNRKYLHHPKEIVSTAVLDSRKATSTHTAHIIGFRPCGEPECKRIHEIFAKVIYNPCPIGLDNMSFRVVLNISRGALIDPEDGGKSLKKQTLGDLYPKFSGFESTQFRYKYASFAATHFFTFALTEHERKLHSAVRVDKNGVPISWSQTAHAVNFVNWIFYLQSTPSIYTPEQNKITQTIAEDWLRRDTGVLRLFATFLEDEPNQAKKALTAIHGELFCSSSRKDVRIAYRCFEKFAHLYGGADWSIAVIVDGQPFFIGVDPKPIEQTAYEHLLSVRWQQEKQIFFMPVLDVRPLSVKESVQSWLEIVINPPKIAEELSSFHFTETAKKYRLAFLRAIDRGFSEYVIDHVAYRRMWLAEELEKVGGTLESLSIALQSCWKEGSSPVSQTIETLTKTIGDLDEGELERVFSHNPKVRTLIIEQLLNIIQKQACTRNVRQFYRLIAVLSRYEKLCPPDVQFFAHVICFQSMLKNPKLQTHIENLNSFLRRRDWTAINSMRKSVSADLRIAIGELTQPPLKPEVLRHACEALSLFIDSPYLIAVQDVVLKAINQLFPRYQGEWNMLRAQLLKRESEGSSTRSMTHGSTVVLRQLLQEVPSLIVIEQISETLQSLNKFQFKANYVEILAYLQSIYSEYPKEWVELRKLVLSIVLAGYSEPIGRTTTAVSRLLRETDSKRISEELEVLKKSFVDRELIHHAISSDSLFRDMLAEGLLIIIQRHINIMPEMIMELIEEINKLERFFTPEQKQYVEIICFQHQVGNEVLQKQIEEVYPHTVRSHRNLFDEKMKGVIGCVARIIKGKLDEYPNQEALKDAITGFHIIVRSQFFPLVHGEVLLQFIRMLDLLNGEYQELFDDPKVETIVRHLFEQRQGTDTYIEHRFSVFARDILFTPHYRLGLFLLKSLTLGNPKSIFDTERLLLDDLLAAKDDYKVFLKKLGVLREWGPKFEAIIKEIKPATHPASKMKTPQNVINLLSNYMDDHRIQYEFKYSYFESINTWMEGAKKVKKEDAFRAFQMGKRHLVELISRGCEPSILVPFFKVLKGVCSFASESEAKLWSEEVEGMHKIIFEVIQTTTPQVLIEIELLITDVFSKKLIGKERRDSIYEAIVAKYILLKYDVPFSLSKWDLEHFISLLISPDTTEPKEKLFRQFCTRIKSYGFKSLKHRDLVVNIVNEQMLFLNAASSSPLITGYTIEFISMLRHLFGTWGKNGEHSKELEDLISVILKSPLFPKFRTPDYAPLFEGLLSTGNRQLFVFVSSIYKEQALNNEKLSNPILALDYLKCFSRFPTSEYFEQTFYIIEKLGEGDLVHFLKAYELGLACWDRLISSEHHNSKRRSTYVQGLVEFSNRSIPGLSRLGPTDRESRHKILMTLLTLPNSLELFSQACLLAVTWSRSHPISCAPLLAKILTLESTKFAIHSFELNTLIPCLSFVAGSTDLFAALAIIDKIDKMPHAFELWKFCTEALEGISLRLFAIDSASEEHNRRKAAVKTAVGSLAGTLTRHLFEVAPHFNRDQNYKSNILIMIDKLMSLYRASDCVEVGIKLFCETLSKLELTPYIKFKICIQIFKYKDSFTEDVLRTVSAVIYDATSFIVRMESETSPPCKFPLNFMGRNELSNDYFVNALILMHRVYFLNATKNGDTLRYDNYKEYYFRALNGKTFHLDLVPVVTGTCLRLVIGSPMVLYLKEICEAEVSKAKSTVSWNNMLYSMFRSNHNKLIDLVCSEFQKRHNRNYEIFSKRYHALPDKTYFGSSPSTLKEEARTREFVATFVELIRHAELDFDADISEKALVESPQEALRFLELSIEKGGDFNLASHKSAADKLGAFEQILDLFLDVQKILFRTSTSYEVLEVHALRLKKIAVKWYQQNQSQFEIIFGNLSVTKPTDVQIFVRKVKLLMDLFPPPTK